jgi:transposase
MLKAQRKIRLTLKKTLDRIKSLEIDKANSIYFFDEARFGLQSSLCRRWAKRGSECTVKVKQGYQNFYVYSSVASKTGAQFSLLLPFVNTEMMQIYLDEFSKSLGSENAILIMDQAGWHKSKDLVVPSNIDIWFLPSYSPELNPVERLWKHIKRNTLHNRLYESLKQLEKAVIDYFDLIDCQLLTKLCACSYI